MLTEIPFSETDNFCNILKIEWPDSASIVQFIQTCQAWKQKNEKFNLSLLYIEENKQSGVFVGYLKSGCKLPVIMVYALETYEEVLKSELYNWRIQWPDLIIVEHVLSRLVPVINEVFVAQSFSLKKHITLNLLSMSIEDASQIAVTYPADVEIKLLSHENLDEIYEVWVMNDTYTIENLKNCLELYKKSAIGVFSKSNNSLLSRCLQHHFAPIAAVQTVEEARRKGYAKLLVKYATRMLAQHSIEPFTTIADFNKISLSLFLSVGYKKQHDLHVFIFTRCKASCV